MNIFHVVGARPNFMKAAPLISDLRRWPSFKQVLVHTGQHYDEKMSKVFFEDLELPRPDINLEVGSNSHAVQTAEIMTGLEQLVITHKPNLVIVYGDVNSTVAAALVCAKLCVPLAHVEAGLRSFDRTMPEEINRIVTDQISNLLFAPSQDAVDNLLREGVAAEKIHLVGNIMIDTLVKLLPKARGRGSTVIKNMRCANTVPKKDIIRKYGLVTLHRPSNVDDPASIRHLIDTLKKISNKIPIIFPVHPRTQKQLKLIRCDITSPSLLFIDPLSYLDFLALQLNAKLVITDSGGIQEETTFLGIPCLTLRENTERPITVTSGTNIIIGRDMNKLIAEVDRILNGNIIKGMAIPLWDGQTASRISQIISELDK